MSAALTRYEWDRTTPEDYGEKAPIVRQARTLHLQLRDANRKVREQEHVIAILDQQIEAIREADGKWTRKCFVCQCPAMCEHREPELVSVWRGLSPASGSTGEACASGVEK